MSAPVLYLGSDAPVKPAHVGRVPAPSVHPARHQSVGVRLFTLHHVVEVGAGCEHGRLPQAFSEDHHQQPGGTEPGNLLQFCRNRHEGQKERVGTLGWQFSPSLFETNLSPQRGTPETTPGATGICHALSLIRKAPNPRATGFPVPTHELYISSSPCLDGRALFLSEEKGLLREAETVLGPKVSPRTHMWLFGKFKCSPTSEDFYDKTL